MGCSTTLLTDKNGSDIGQFLYTPFGETWVEEASTVDISHITRFFTNQQFDKESGLYYYNARYYDPHLGSFITPDPAMDGLNHYNYCASNPITYTDPTGLEYMSNGYSMDYNTGASIDTPGFAGNSIPTTSSSSTTPNDAQRHRRNVEKALRETAFNNWVYANCSNKWADAIKNGYNGPFNYRGYEANYNPETEQFELASDGMGYGEGPLPYSSPYQKYYDGSLKRFKNQTWDIAAPTDLYCVYATHFAAYAMAFNEKFGHYPKFSESRKARRNAIKDGAIKWSGWVNDHDDLADSLNKTFGTSFGYKYNDAFNVTSGTFNLTITTNSVTMPWIRINDEHTCPYLGKSSYQYYDVWDDKLKSISSVNITDFGTHFYSF